MLDGFMSERKSNITWENKILLYVRELLNGEIQHNITIPSMPLADWTPQSFYMSLDITHFECLEHQALKEEIPYLYTD